MEWDVKRILVAVAILLFIILLPIYIFTADSYDSSSEEYPNQTKGEKQGLSDLVANQAKEDSSVVENLEPIDMLPTEMDITSNLEESLVSPTLTNEIKETPLGEHNISINKKIKSEAKIKPTSPDIENDNKVKSIKHIKIRRALLTTGLKNKEPIDNIKSPVIINNNNKDIKLYYFTEIRNMEGETLYHQWEWENKFVFKREIKILGKRWRASTNKLLPDSKEGYWVVKLLNKEGDVLNNIEFQVIRK